MQNVHPESVMKQLKDRFPERPHRPWWDLFCLGVVAMVWVVAIVLPAAATIAAWIFLKPSGFWQNLTMCVVSAVMGWIEVVAFVVALQGFIWVAEEFSCWKRGVYRI